MKLDFSNIKEFYDTNNRGHGVDHIQRVYENALRIAETEDCDFEVVKAAAVLHDVARHLDENDPSGPCHAEKGAEMAREILKSYDYTQKQKENIIHCVRVHRYSSKLKPETIEAGIIKDADRLDALGAILIARLFCKCGEMRGVMHDPSIPIQEYKGAAHTKTAINHFYEKILKIKPETFNTAKGRELAANRYGFTKEYVEQFLKEWDCKI